MDLVAARAPHSLETRSVAIACHRHRPLTPLGARSNPASFPILPACATTRNRLQAINARKPSSRDDGGLPGKAKGFVVDRMRDGARRPIELSNTFLDLQTNQPQVIRAVFAVLLLGLVSSFVLDL